jgi:hypothetical protein
VSLPSHHPCSIVVNTTPPHRLQFAIALPLQAITLSIVKEFTVTLLMRYRRQRHTATLRPNSHSIGIASSLSIVEEFAVTLPLQYLAHHAALRLPYNCHCRQSLSSLLRNSPLASTLQAVTLSIVEEFAVMSPLQYHWQRHTTMPPPNSHSIAIASSLSIVEEFAVLLPLQYLAHHANLRLP